MLAEPIGSSKVCQPQLFHQLAPKGAFYLLWMSVSAPLSGADLPGIFTGLLFSVPWTASLSHSNCSQSFDGSGSAQVLLPVSAAKGAALCRAIPTGSSACGSNPLCNQGLSHVYVRRRISLSLCSSEIIVKLSYTKSLCTCGAKAFPWPDLISFYFGLFEGIFIFYGRNTVSLLKSHGKMRRRREV